MTRTRLLSIVALVATLSLGTAAWALRRPAESGCTSARVGFATSAPITAVANNRLVAVDGESGVTAARVDECLRALVAPSDAVLRHVDSRRGVGTAYVLDDDGPDRIALLGRTGTRMMQTGGEALHPAWSPDGQLAWAEDFDTLQLMSADMAQVESIPLPAKAVGVFSPQFTPAGDLVAVMQEPVPRLPIEDDGLDNLWRYSAADGRWRQLTHFDGTAENWSIIRTPVVSADGSIDFVRITGAASATRKPRFELWRIEAGTVRKVRALPGDVYLAGETAGGLLFNARATRCADWALFQGAGPRSEFLGCGAVAVEPTTMLDPDAEHEHEDDATADPAPAGRTRMSIVIGDFRSRARAEQIERLVGTGRAAVLGHKAAPEAVRPGAWVVAVPVSASEDPQAALEAVRARYPSVAGRTWLAPTP